MFKHSTHGRRPTLVSVALTCFLLLAFLPVGVLTFLSTKSSSASAAAISPTAVLIHPGIVKVSLATAGPPTTAYCEKTYHIPCYQASQIQQAYNLAPLFNRGITGKGQTIIIVDSFGSPT